MKNWDVTLPIAGHASLSVEAESAEDAIEKALEVVEFKNIDDWEALRQFHQGNISHCPSPWEAEAQLGIGEEED